MLKHFDSSLSFISNETKIALYIEIIKPLILTLPDVNDKVKAIAWFRKIIFDNSSLLVRIEYLELLLKFLKHRKLSGFFAGLPDTRRPLQKFNKRTKQHQQQLPRCDNKINTFIEEPSKNVENDEDKCLPQKNTFKYKYMEVVHHVNKSEHNTRYFKRNNRISAGYSPLTKREIQHELKNIINSPGDDNEKINKCKAMLTANYLPPRTISDENELIRLGHPKHSCRGKMEKYFNMYNATPAYEHYNSKLQNVFCKRKGKCINRTTCECENPVDEKKYHHVHGKNNETVENEPVKATLKKENKQSKELDQYCGEICKNSKLESFLVGSKKYLTLCVSKECLVERNILKCVKYIISNAECKFFKFKEYLNSEKNLSMPKPRKTNDISKKNHANSFLNNKTRRKKSSSYAPENNQTFFSDNAYLTRLRSLVSDNITFANVSNTCQNMIGKCIYIKISLILAVGTIFFWKIYQIIFACQCKRVGYSTKLVSQISNYRKNLCSPYVFTFVGCFILYQLLKDFINIFFEPY